MKKLLTAIKKGKGSKVSLKSRYEQKCSDRSPYLTRAESYAKATLPYLLNDSNRGGDANDHGFNGFNAQAVNHLANRIVHNLFPAHQSFFQLDWTQDEKDKLKQAGYEPSELTSILIASTNRVHDYESQTDSRSVMVNVVKNLLVAGNVCLFTPPDKKPMKAIPLNQYCVVRDSSDSLIELFTEQKKMFSTFSVELQALIKSRVKTKEIKDETEIELITWAIRFSEDKFYVVQTAEDILLSDHQEVHVDDLPWLPLRWNTAFEEDYGRGLVEDHWSDFKVLQFLNEARMKGMVMMADVKYLVKHGAVTDIDQLATSPTGEFLVGNLDDIGVLQLERYADFSPIIQTIGDYERRLGQVFLMQSAVQRDAERVTAYEIRLQAQELNESLGGIYSHLAATLQRPYAYILLKRTGFPLAKESVKPTILTGLAALAKAGELEKIRLFTETMGMLNTWHPELQQRTDVYSMAMKVAAALSLELDYVRNDEEQAEVSAQQQQAQMQQQVGMEASKAAPKVLEQAASQMMQPQ